MVPLHGSRALLAVLGLFVLGTSCGGGGGDGGVEPRRPTSIQAASSASQDNQPAGGNAAQAPGVLVRDQDNAPLGGVSVSFAVTAGGGSISPSTVTTGSDGIARATTWTMGPTPGVNVATATAGGLAAVQFNATSIRAATSVQAASAATQAASVGTNVSDPPAVIVRDGANTPMPGVTVMFAVTGGGGAISPASVVTGADGIARLTSWTLGNDPGANTVTATVTGLPVVTFAATATLPPTSVTAVSATSQSAPAGSAVADRPAVVVRALNNSPVPGVIVTFAVTSGGGVVTPTTVVTGADGIARVTTWTLGGTPGTNTLTATVSGVGSVLFTATGLEPSVATSIEAASSTGLVAPAKSAVSPAPTVRVRDQFGNPMAGVTVTFAVTAGGGSISPANGIVVTDANGEAKINSWVLGSAAGTNTLTATAAGVTGSVVFNATATLVATTVQAVTTTTQDGFVNNPVPIPPSVQVRDQNGDPLPGVEVAFAITAGGGSVTPPSMVTDVNGLATVTTWVLGPTAGTNTMTATVTGLTPVVFNANAQPDPCAPIDINVGTTLTSNLSSESCQIGGRFYRFARFSITQQTTVRLRQSSTQFDTYVYLLKADGTPVAEDDDSGTGGVGGLQTNSELVAYLAPGTYIVAATSFAAGETGSFELAVLAVANHEVTGCVEAWVVAGVSTNQAITANDITTCEESGAGVDTYVMYLDAGQQVTINMTSSAVDSRILFLAANGDVLVANDPSSNNAQLQYTAPTEGYYVFGASTGIAGQTGAYTLSVTIP